MRSDKKATGLKPTPMLALIQRMKVLVTGAAGLIGYHAAERLLRRGESAIDFDNVNAYYDSAIKERRLARIDETAFQSASSRAFVRADLTDRDAVEQLFRVHAFDCVIYLAAQAGVCHSASDTMAAADPSWNSDAPDPATSNAPLRVFSIGNNTPLPVVAFIDTIEAAIERRAEHHYLPLQPGDVAHTFAGVSRLEHAVAYEPATPVEVATERSVAWYREFYRV